jgi:glutaredoxin 3
MASVEIYTKSTCGYCIRARRLLETKQVEFIEYVIDGGGPMRMEMIQRSGGRTTVPQIFVGGRHIGGCDDLYALERDGKLNDLFAQ